VPSRTNLQSPPRGPALPLSGTGSTTRITNNQRLPLAGADASYEDRHRRACDPRQAKREGAPWKRSALFFRQAQGPVIRPVFGKKRPLVGAAGGSRWNFR
jgi:hypothetical protein